MSTIFSTVLIASPPAFLAGWIFSKALFRQLALQRSLIDDGKPANTVASAVNPIATGQIDQVLLKKAVAERQQAQQHINQLREQLGAAQQRLQPLQGELRLLKEAVAERDHQVIDLRRKLQLQGSPPEVDVSAATGSDTAKNRELLQTMRDRLTAQELITGEQTGQLARLQERLQGTLRRAHKWRLKFKPLLRQLRQQRTMINELREDLRQREQRQNLFDAAQAQKSAARPMQQAVVAIPVSTPIAADSRSDFSDVNQENLQILRGLGPTLHKKLNESGIYRLGQLAAMNPEEYYRLCRSLGIAYKIAIRNDWPACARQLLDIVPAHSDAQVDPQPTVNAEHPN